MAYSSFTLDQVRTQFALTISDRDDLFSTVEAITPSDLLRQTLDEFVPLATAIATEKARSEFLIAPVLAEVRRRHPNRISLFSGTEFNVDPETGLQGFCDFLISASPEQFTIQAPIMAIVEAKNENITGGLGQCLAEMVAAQQFNRHHNQSRSVLYGVVTTGTNWRFLQLQQHQASIDRREYFINELPHILGVFETAIAPTTP